MNKSNKYSPEVRERTLRLIQEHRGEYPSLWAAVASIAPKTGCVPQTLLDWIKRTEVDSGARPGTTTADARRIKELERDTRFGDTRFGVGGTRFGTRSERDALRRIGRDASGHP